MLTNPIFKQSGGSNGLSFFQGVIPGFVGLSFVLGTLIFFFMLLWGSIQWISSGGDKQALEGARGRITNAVVGLVLLFASFAIIKLIQAFFHVQILTLDIGPLVIQ